MNTRRVYRQTATRRNSIELLLFIPLLILILFFLYELPKRHAWCSKLLWKKRKSDLASAEHKKCFEICVHTKQKISSFFTKFFSSTFFFFFRLHYPIWSRGGGFVHFRNSTARKPDEETDRWWCVIQKRYMWPREKFFKLRS